jgi:3-methylfumaryl-CoA hydratase
MHQAPTTAAVLTRETCSVRDARRIAAMLDRDASHLTSGALLPFGWHFPLLAGETRRSALRGDGFPGLGVEMPDLGLPRLLLAGREIDQRADIRLGSDIERRSALVEIASKDTAAGPMTKVTLRHELQVLGAASAAIVETQSFFLLPAGRPRPLPPGGEDVVADVTKIVTPDETMLFQYSALGFNSHKIHIDRDYVRDVEGYPDLIVNGGLATLLLIEFLVGEIGVVPRNIKTRHTAPLFCGRPITLAATRGDDGWRLSAHDEMGRTAVKMELLAK